MSSYLLRSFFAKIGAPLLLLLITCAAYSQPCQGILVGMTSTSPAGIGGSGNPIRICQNTTVTFVANATFSTSSVGAKYIWTYGDGTPADTTNNLVATHTYLNGGVYIVDLLAVDPAGCTNTNRLQQVVQVSTTPLFTGTYPTLDSICLNTATVVHGLATPVPAVYNCAPPVADTTFLPDDGGTTSYNSTIQVSCFALGATITNANQVQSICLDMEHSFLGDLQIKIVCPNNQSAILKEYASPSGGGTFLGEPNDPGPGNNIPGIGYDYCFANNATWGTMVSLSTTNTVAVTGMAPGTPGNALIAGTYTPFQSFNNLIGCPLNGNWTINVVDNLFSDNGFIFSWGVNFDPSLLPGNYSFTPNFITEGWNTNPDVISTSSNGHDITVRPTTGGLKSYTYHVTDNFGCIYDTTVSVFVKDPGNPGLDTAIKVCSNQNPINAFDYLGGNPQPGGTWTGTGVTTAGQFDPITAGIGTFDITYTKTTGGCDTTATITVTVVNDVVMDFDFTVTKGCTEDVVHFNNLSEAGTFHWKYGDGTFPLDTVTSPTHTYVDQGIYAVQLKVRNMNGCIDSITKLVDVTHPLNAAFTSSADTICLSEAVLVNFTDQSVGATNWNWNFDEGYPVTTQNASHIFTEPGLHNVRLIIHDNIPCYDTAYFPVQVDSIPYFSMALDRYAMCTGEQVNISAEFYNTTIRNINWNFGDGTQWSQISGTSHHYENEGTYWITADADFGVCGVKHTRDSVIINAFPKVNLGPDSVLCLNGPSILVTELNNASDPNIKWLWSTGETTPTLSITQPGIYSLTATKNDCATTENIEVNKDCYTDLPNAFTPNGDGVNDYFYPRQLLSKGVVGFSMTIFDRWGQKLFETTNTNGRGWDGKFNEKDQPMGVYIYQIKAVLKNGRLEEYNGNITLVR